jgi:hypothetical protein
MLHDVVNWIVTDSTSNSEPHSRFPSDGSALRTSVRRNFLLSNLLVCSAYQVRRSGGSESGGMGEIITLAYVKVQYPQ